MNAASIITGHVQRLLGCSVTAIPNSSRQWVWIEGVTIEQVFGVFRYVAPVRIAELVCAFPADTAVIDASRYEGMPLVSVSSSGRCQDVLGRIFWNINNNITITKP